MGCTPLVHRARYCHHDRAFRQGLERMDRIPKNNPKVPKKEVWKVDFQRQASRTLNLCLRSKQLQDQSKLTIARSQSLLNQIIQRRGKATCRIEAEAEAQSENLEHNRALQLKAQFLEMLNHELRNPLAIVVTSAELLSLLDAEMSAAERHEHYQEISSSAFRIVTFLETSIHHLKALLSQD